MNSRSPKYLYFFIRVILIKGDLRYKTEQFNPIVIEYLILGLYFSCLERKRLTPGTAITRPTENICGNSTCLKTPQNYSKEGRLTPFFANNVDIPFARARRLKPCPRKAVICSGRQRGYNLHLFDLFGVL